jgi:hypothetical protein
MEKIHIFKLGALVFDTAVSFNFISGWTDVNYIAGNVLIIREYDYENNRFTGRNLLSKIIRVENNPKSASSVLLRFELINPADFFNSMECMK